MKEYWSAPLNRCLCVCCFAILTSVAGLSAQLQAQTSRRSTPLADPVVQIIRESNPATAPELVAAMKAMVDYGRIDEVKRYQKSLMALEIDDKTMFELNMEFGSELFIRLRQIPELRPASAAFAMRLFAGSDRYVRSPERINGFIDQLGDDNIDRRVAAISGLIMARENAIAPLMRGLLDNSKKDVHPRMVTTIASMGASSVEPVMAIAKSDDLNSYLKAGAIMHVQKNRGSLPLLCMKLISSKPGSQAEAFTLATIDRVAGSRPSRKSAANYLELHFEKIQHKLGLTARETQTVPHWVWNPGERKLTKTELTLPLSLLAEAVEVAEAIYQSDTNDSRNKIRYWLLKLEYEKLGVEPHAKLASSKFGDLDAQFVLMILDEAIKQDRMEAAIAAVELIGQMGDASYLHSVGGKTSMIVRGLNHSNYRLRYAATKAIARWNPEQAFAGSSYYLKNLALLAGINAERRILIIEPNGVLADDLAGFLNSAGYLTDSFNHGRDFLRQTTRRVDYEFAVISGAVNRPGTLEVLQRLRANPHTGRFPVALVGHADQMSRLREYADTDEFALAFSWPTTRISLEFIIEKMRELSGRDYVSPDQRVAHAEFAFDQLLKFSRNRKDYSFFNILQYEQMYSRAIFNDKLGPKSIELVGWLATPAAQRILVNLASSTATPLPIRKLALEGFSNAIQQRSTLLNRSELQAQYNRYNASEFLDEATQKMRGEILDVLEARAKGKSK